MKILLWVILFLIGLILISYISFWLYVRYGGEKVTSVNPSAWLRPNPGTDHREKNSLSGPGNFRTLGGLQIDSNHSVRSGVLFRSDSPSKYTEEDWQKLENMNVGLVIDLRSDKETVDDKYVSTTGIQYVRTPIYRNDPMREAFTTLLYERENLSKMMADAYVDMLTQRADKFGEAINLIAENLDSGIIFHCTAGKDRTGILSALILTYLGVDSETILYDFALSNNGFESNYQAFLKNEAGPLMWYGIPANEMQIFFAVDPKWLINSIKLVEEKYGSIESYLINEAKVKQANLDKLKKELIIETAWD